MIYKAVYKRQPDCIACMNLGWAPPEACAECLKLVREYDEQVDILQLGVGLFANKAVIRKSNGQLETVPINELIIND